MFVETITAPAGVWHHWTDRLRLFTDPPVALFASIGWDNGDGTVSAVNVWDLPAVVADFFVERVEPVIAAQGSQNTSRSGTVSPLLPTSARPATAGAAAPRAGTHL